MPVVQLLELGKLKCLQCGQTFWTKWWSHCKVMLWDIQLCAKLHRPRVNKQAQSRSQFISSNMNLKNTSDGGYVFHHFEVFNL